MRIVHRVGAYVGVYAINRNINSQIIIFHLRSQNDAITRNNKLIAKPSAIRSFACRHAIFISFHREKKMFKLMLNVDRDGAHVSPHKQCILRE